MKLKKMVSLFTVMCMLVALSSGCSKSTSTPSSKDATPASGTPAPNGLISKDPIKLKIYAKKAATVTPFDQLEHFIKHSKDTNVFVEWEQPPDGTSTERFNIVLASGTLPDMFWNLVPAEYDQLKAIGGIMPVQKYLSEKDAPSFNKVLKQYPDSVKDFTQPNGDVLFLPLFDELSTNDPLIVRGDWLDKLGLKLPVTMAEWEAYWKAVKATDLNGNGKNDEIPFSGETVDSVRSLVSAYGMIDRFFVDPKDSNKIKYSNIEPRYKDFLIWANGLYSQGYIDHDIAVSDSKAFATKVAQNVVASYRGKLNGAFNTYMSTMPPKIPGFKLYGAEPMKAADGSQLHPGCVSVVRTNLIGGVVTKTNKYPAETVKWTDWFYDFTPETGGAFINIFGPKDVTFKYGPDGKPQYTDYVLKNPDGLSTQQALTKYTTRGQHAAITPSIGSFAMWNPLTTEAYSRVEPFYKNSLKYVVPNLPTSNANAKIIRAKMADITTYADEMVLKFITGVEPISKFDDFTKRIKSMGIDDVLTIYNNDYKEWSKPR